MEFFIFALILIVLFIGGLPVAFALGITGLILLKVLWGDTVNLGIVAQRLLYGANNFVILAIPFFLLAGKLMNTGGITRRIFRFANLLVGHLQGGLGQVNIVASMIFSGMSGLAAADTAGLGTVEIQAMREAGYDDDFTCAVTGASSTVGPIVPPSVPLVIYGILANVSVGRLLVAGLIPGVLVGLSLMIMVSIYAGRKGYPRFSKPSFRELLQAFKEAFGPLMTPVILIGGILSGIFTPTEAAAIAALYALILGCFLYKEISLSDTWRLLKQTARETATITFIISCAMLYGWVLIRSRTPIVLLEFFTGISTNPIVILFILNGFLLILGCFMETIAALSILVPIITPLIIKVGIDPLHFGLVMVLNLMIGLLTPPFGINLFILNKISGVPTMKVARACLPFFIPLISTLLVITLFPSIVTVLPTLFFGAK